MSDLLYLSDIAYRVALSNDLQSAETVYASAVTLSPHLITLFEKFCRRGGHLSLVTNSIHRYPAILGQQLSIAARLRSVGARVTFYDCPYLLHAKCVIVSPDIVYLGSHNLTAQALNRNIERSVRITSLGLFTKVLADLNVWGGWMQ